MKSTLLVMLFVFITFSVHSELIVISDYGGHAMTDYYEGIDPQDIESQEHMKQMMPFNVSEELYLPITSVMAPGNVESIDIDIPSLQPFIIIGYDELSIQWLKMKKSDLEAMTNIVGIVVNVNSIDELNYLRNLVNIPLYPMQGDDLTERLNIYKYPVLVTGKFIEQ